MHYRVIIFLLFLLTPAISFSAAEAPLANSHLPLQDSSLHWDPFLADAAAEIGMPSLAEGFYKKILATLAPEDEAYSSIVLKLSSVLLQEAKYEEARQILETTAYKTNSSWYLRHAWTGLADKKWTSIEQDLSSIQKEDLNPCEKAWYYLLKGLYKQAQNQYDQAEKDLNKALATAESDIQKARIQSLIFKTRISQKTLDAAAFENLKAHYHKETEDQRFSPMSLDYALALSQNNQEEEALNILQHNLALLPPDDTQHRPQFLLLVGFLKGAETETGRKALQDLLLLKDSPALQSTALQLLTQANIEENQPEFFQALLQEWQAQGGHPLWDEIELLRAYSALSKGKLDEAESFSKALLETKPKSKLRTNALSLLAYISWQRTPPRYRNAADYLAQLKQETLDPDEQARLDLLIADCFFQNKDYDSAAQKYQELLKKTNHSLPRGQIFYQAILAFLEGGKLEEALALLKLGSSLQGIDPMYTWKANWNYSYKLYTLGKTQEALHYLSAMQERNLPLGLSLRLQWLRAQLYLLNNKPVEALEWVSHLFKTLDSSEAKEETQIDEIAAEGYLLKARAYVKLQKPEAALPVFKYIRDQYPESRAARFSFLDEARFQASSNKLVEALRLCVHLADSHSSSDEAPIALYEAAHYAELVGQSSSVEQALLFLERLYNDYQSSHLAYYARVKQGDLLRRLNRFESAYLIYKHLLVEYPSHPDAPYIKLSEAKTLLALDPTREDYFQAIVSTCEYLADLAKIDLTLRLEAAYTLAFTYVKKNRLVDAEQQYWRLIHYCLKERTNEANTLSRKSQYWLSRGIFDLAALLEQRRAFSEAKMLYQLILDHKLPGVSLAKAKLD